MNILKFRDCSSELFRVRAALDDVTEQLETSRRENKNLALEIKDLLEQLGDGGRSLHEVEKQCRRLDEEKEELNNALEEAEAALEQVIRMMMTSSKVDGGCHSFKASLKNLEKINWENNC